MYLCISKCGWVGRKRKSETRNLLHLMYHMLYVCMYVCMYVLCVYVCMYVYVGGRGCFTVHRRSGNQKQCASMTRASDSLCITPL